MKKIKLTLGMPSASEMLHRKFVESLMNLQYPTNCEIAFVSTFGVQLPFSRNRIVQEALDNNSDYLFFVDVDMIFRPDSIVRLLNRQVDICHALSFRRISPHYPCLFNWNSKNSCYESVDYSKGENDMISVDAAGSACTLIKMEVFKKMKKPFYYYKDHLFSSDLTFSMNAKKLGYEIFVDRTLKTGHIGSERIITEEEYLTNMTEESKEEWNANMKKALKEKQLYENSNIDSNTGNDSTRTCSETNSMASKN